MSIISILFLSGKACQKEAMAPAIIGDAKEVPLFFTNLSSGPITVAPAPKAIPSGLILPSALGPLELNAT